jgi:hypothetical protein
MATTAVAAEVGVEDEVISAVAVEEDLAVAVRDVVEVALEEEVVHASLVGTEPSRYLTKGEESWSASDTMCLTHTDSPPKSLFRS